MLTYYYPANFFEKYKNFNKVSLINDIKVSVKVSNNCYGLYKYLFSFLRNRTFFLVNKKRSYYSSKFRIKGVIQRVLLVHSVFNYLIDLYRESIKLRKIYESGDFVYLDDVKKIDVNLERRVFLNVDIQLCGFTDNLMSCYFIEISNSVVYNYSLLNYIIESNLLSSSHIAVAKKELELINEMMNEYLEYIDEYYDRISVFKDLESKEAFVLSFFERYGEIDLRLLPVDIYERIYKAKMSIEEFYRICLDLYVKGYLKESVVGEYIQIGGLRIPRYLKLSKK